MMNTPILKERDDVADLVAESGKIYKNQEYKPF